MRTKLVDAFHVLMLIVKIAKIWQVFVFNAQQGSISLKPVKSSVCLAPKMVVQHVPVLPIAQLVWMVMFCPQINAKLAQQLTANFAGMEYALNV
jgi:hypothetical protein